MKFPTHPAPALALVLAGAISFTLAGCGGGGSSASSSASAPPIAASAVLSGTAATGSALANASVAITDGAGQSPCQEAAITTTAQGGYTCTLKSGETAPFFVVVTDPSGNNPPMASVASVTPTPGTPVVANATPLTNAILAQLAPDGKALTLVAGHAVNAANLQATTTNVVAQLANVLGVIGAPSGYNPFTTPITAASVTSDGNTADELLDVVQVVTDPATGDLALTTVDNPTPVLLASASSSGAALAAPSAVLNTLPLATQWTAQQLQGCFALPTGQRVLGSNTGLTPAQGGPSATSLASICQGLVSSAGGAGGIDFLQNGYTAGQFFYSVLTSDSMTGAQFSVPQVMAFYPAASSASGHDEAVLNLKYVDASGNPGNLITVAQNIPGSASSVHPSPWWLTGNQQPVDVVMRPVIRLYQELNAASSVASRFQNGIEFVINATGPGSVGTGGSLSEARVTGPGLPAGGLVYTAPTTAELGAGQYYMDLSNKTGTIPASNQCSNCPNFWLSRTAGLTTSSGAGVLATNYLGLTYAQPSDGVNLSQFTMGQSYQVELFYGTSTTPGQVFKKTLLSNLTPATQGVLLPWSGLGSQSLAALDPNGSLNGVLPSLTVDWVQNAAAEQINTVLVTSASNGDLGNSQSVPLGASSVVFVASPAIPALTSSSNRAITLGYRTLDDSRKTAEYMFN